MRSLIQIVFLGILSTNLLCAQNLAQAKASAKKDLEDAIIRLNELRQKIEKEKFTVKLIFSVS